MFTFDLQTGSFSLSTAFLSEGDFIELVMVVSRAVYSIGLPWPSVIYSFIGRISRDPGAIVRPRVQSIENPLKIH